MPTSVDVAAYLMRLVGANKSQHPYLEYRGPDSGVHALMDPIQFEQVIDHLIDNARRYRTAGGCVEVAVVQADDEVIVQVYNDGPQIAASRLESIFKYRNSDRSEKNNHGIGLFAARTYLVAMKAKISALNQPNGVTFEIRLARTASEGKS